MHHASNYCESHLCVAGRMVGARYEGGFINDLRHGPGEELLPVSICALLASSYMSVCIVGHEYTYVASHSYTCIGQYICIAGNSRVLRR